MNNAVDTKPAATAQASGAGIRVQVEAGVCSIAFDRLDKKNAITAAMYQAMADALEAGETNTEVRAFLIHGHPQCFTAGNDLKDFLENPPSGGQSPVFQFLRAISTASKPIVAAVAGVSVGVGTTMLMHCDMVYCADNAKFSMPFAKLGLCPEAASSYLLPQIAGYQRAAQALLLGDVFDAHAAKEMGLVNRVLPNDELMPFAQQQLAKLVALPASSLKATKEFLKAGQAQAVAQRMLDEGVEFRRLLQSPEAKAAFSAFLRK